MAQSRRVKPECPSDLRPRGRCQIDRAKTERADALWLENPLATVRAVAGQAGVSRDTAWVRRQELELAGLLPAMSRRDRGRARNRERFAEVMNDPESAYNTRPRRYPKGWRNLTQIEITDPDTGVVVWRSPAFPNLHMSNSAEEFTERLRKELLPFAEEMHRHAQLPPAGTPSLKRLQPSADLRPRQSLRVERSRRSL
jgi:hypothetical protein